MVHFVFVLFAAHVFPSDAVHPPKEEVKNFLEAICPGEANPSGCTVCPPETPFRQESWEVRGIFEGHFRSPTSEDALVTGFGCEPHVHGFSGAFLFTKEGPAWKKIWYRPGIDADGCKKLTGADGRERLICTGGDMHQGFADLFLYILDPGQDPGSVNDDTPFMFFDVMDSLGACVALPDGTVHHGSIERVTFEPLPAGHRVRIQVTAQVGQASIPAKTMENCPFGGPSRLQIRTMPRRYEFTFDGAKIVPARGNPPVENTWTAVAPVTSYSVNSER